MGASIHHHHHHVDFVCGLNNNFSNDAVRHRINNIAFCLNALAFERHRKWDFERESAAPHRNCTSWSQSRLGRVKRVPKKNLLGLLVFTGPIPILSLNQQRHKALKDNM